MAETGLRADEDQDGGRGQQERRFILPSGSRGVMGGDRLAGETRVSQTSIGRVRFVPSAWTSRRAVCGPEPKALAVARTMTRQACRGSSGSLPTGIGRVSTLSHSAGDVTEIDRKS
jgi:hypothetical protein